MTVRLESPARGGIRRVGGARRRRGASIVPVLVGLAALFMVLPFRPAGRQVEMTGSPGRFAYRPATVSVAAKQSISFENTTRATHTATCDGCSTDTGDVQPGQTRAVRLSRPGTYVFFCRYHRLSDRMETTVRVTGG